VGDVRRDPVNRAGPTGRSGRKGADAAFPPSAGVGRAALPPRVIEIRDGELALRPFTPRVSDDDVRQEALRLGIGDDALPAVTAAAEWELARRRKARGEPPRTVARTRVLGGADLESEVEQLRAIARAWRDARLVVDRVERTVAA